MKIIVLMMCLFTISGCAALKEKLEAIAERNRGYGSYVAPDISKSDADELTMDMSQFLMNQLPAAKTTLELEPLKNPLHAMLLDQLARKGFGIVESMPQTGQQGEQLRYLVTRLDRGLLVRLRYQDKEASRFYDRTVDGRLSLRTGYTIREAAK
ncbi:hypothetical protein [Nitrosospira sp. NpAV]|uniref:hypothetical protein n=1 Tax=Nitrosospira sp. NpAV TaxID=58133 RepID=UPI00069835F9|nr:hypothetical protein [Nitrosospira sp. NpAV]